MTTNDDQNNEQSPQPVDDSQPQRPLSFREEVTGLQSRRKFLRAAIISGAGVATVAATAGIAAACQNTIPSVFAGEGDTPTPSGTTSTCALCFEDTKFLTLDSFNIDQNGNNTPGQFYLWFTAQNLPQGSYKMVITFKVNNTGTEYTMMHSPFTYHPGGGNQAFLYQKSANTAVTCPHFTSTDPNTDPQLPGGEVAHATAVQGYQGLFCYDTTGSGNVDLQMAVHMDWDGTKITEDTDYYFTGTLTDCDDNTVCTTPALKVTAKYVPHGN